MADVKQNALPLEEQRMDETPNDSVAATEASRKAEGRQAYLALARGVRDCVVKFVAMMDAGGGPDCLLNCDDYDDAQLSIHLHEFHRHLHGASKRANAMVERLEVLLQVPVPYELTEKEPE